MAATGPALPSGAPSTLHSDGAITANARQQLDSSTKGTEGEKFTGDEAPTDKIFDIVTRRDMPEGAAPKDVEDSDLARLTEAIEVHKKAIDALGNEEERKAMALLVQLTELADMKWKMTGDPRDAQDADDIEASNARLGNVIQVLDGGSSRESLKDDKWALYGTSRATGGEYNRSGEGSLWKLYTEVDTKETPS